MTKICTSKVWPVIGASNVCSTMIHPGGGKENENIDLLYYVLSF